MSVDEGSDYEEEEFLIYADFKNQLAPLELDKNTAVKIIGLEADPIAEVNGNVFKGTYDYSMGTCVIFEKDIDATPPDPLFENSCRQKYKYTAKTNKVINFERIFVENKVVESTETPSNEDTEKATAEKDCNIEREKQTDDEELRINMSYDEAIKLFPANDYTAE